MTNNTTELTDDFRGDDANLISSIKALIELNDEGALVPHGIGSHARSLLSAAAVRLTSPRAAVPWDDELIKHMVDRFLGWPLPADFNPDAGISFKPTFNDHLPDGPMRHTPSGTNLLNGAQAEEMVRHMLAAITFAEAEPIPMLLFCPRCGTQHIDAPESEPGRLISGGQNAGRAVAPKVTWTNPPHRSHLCHACGIVWRPADVATIGVEAIETSGKADTWTKETPWIGHNRPDAQAVAADGEAKPSQFFVYDAEGCYFETFATDAERDKAHRDLIAEYRVDARQDQEWPDAVAGIISGIVTHTTSETWVDNTSCDYEPRAAVSPATAESKCTRCGSSTAQTCNELGCFYLESGEGEPATADERAAASAEARVLAAARKLIDIRHKETTRDHEIIVAIDALEVAVCGVPADAGEAVSSDPIAALIARHAEELGRNDYAYFELAYTRQTGWMAWITDKPLQGPVLNPDRKVLARGQGGTPAEACRDALDAAQGAQGGKGGDRG